MAFQTPRSSSYSLESPCPLVRHEKKTPIDDARLVSTRLAIDQSPWWDGYGMAMGWLRGGDGVVTGWLQDGYGVVTGWLWDG